MWSLLQADQTLSRLPQENRRPGRLLCSDAKSLEQKPPACSCLLNRRLLEICLSHVAWRGREPLLDDPCPTALSIPHPFAPEHLSLPQNSLRSESRSSSRRGSPRARLRSGNRIRRHQTLQSEERLLSSER